MVNKQFSIDGTVYPFDVHVHYGNDISMCFDWFKEFIDPTDHDDLKELINLEYLGKTIRLGGFNILIHISEEAEVSVIAHEAFHAVEYILDDIGIKHNAHTSEAYAYLLSFLVKEITRNIKDDN